jgi:UDP:flavonoid glycosyltransferase YjiC (YdhE family)
MGTIASTYAPFSELFPRARAVVHSGGIGTVSQALRSGRPMVVTPYGFDQPDNAARLARLGTSRTIYRNAYTAERITTQLERLLQRPRYTERAVALAQRLHDEDGARVACDAIEDQLRNGR